MVDSACDKYDVHIDGITFHAATVTEQTKDSWSDSCLLHFMRKSFGRTPSIGCKILGDGEVAINLTSLKKARVMDLVGDPIKMAVIKVGGKNKNLHYILMTSQLCRRMVK